MPTERGSTVFNYNNTINTATMKSKTWGEQYKGVGSSSSSSNSAPPRLEVDDEGNLVLVGDGGEGENQCVYVLQVSAGSVLGIHGPTPINEAGMFQVI